MKLTKNRFLLTALLVVFAALPGFAAKAPDKEPAAAEGEEGKEGEASAAERIIDSRLVAVACSSEERTEEDDILLGILTETINTMGSYEGITSAAVLPEGVLPTPEDIPVEEFPSAPLYVLTGSRQAAEGKKDVTNYVMTLWNIKTGAIPGSNQIEYTDVNELKVAAQLLVAQLFFLVPPPATPTEPENFAWKNSRLFVTMNVAGSFHLIDARNWMGVISETHAPGLSASAGFEYQFLMTKGRKFGLALAAEGGVNWFGFDYAETNSDGSTQNYMELGGIVPVMLKVTFYPHQFVLSPYGGGFYSFAFSMSSGEPHQGFGWLAGIEAGTRCGRGVLSIFGRFLCDLNANPLGGSQYEFWGYRLAGGMTYKFSLAPRPQKTPIAVTGGW